MSAAWKLDCGPDGSILFGPQSTNLPFAIAPEIGDPSRENQDGTLPGVDGSFFGVDTTGGQTIAFGLTAVGDTDAEANALYSAFRKVWRADTIRRTPGAVATLTAPSGRSTFGRPRRITPTYYPTDAAVIGITADFSTTDDLWYGDEESLTVPFAISQSGGLVAPLKSPLVARGYTTRENTFTVTGEQPTWPIITIRGPVLNPQVEVAGRLLFAASTSLAYDEWLTIDTRPGLRSVLRNGSRIAALARSSTLLPSASIPPGAHTFTLSGSSSTGNPTATIAWRPAHSTP
jgi:hypothetical protein